MNGDAIVHAVRGSGLDPDARILDGVGEVPAEGRPRLGRLPPHRQHHVTQQRAAGHVEPHVLHREHTPVGVRDVGGDLSGQQLVVAQVRRDREPEPEGLVQQADRHDARVQAPRPGRAGRRIAAQTPEPAQVPRVELHVRLVLLPPPEDLEHVVHLVGAGLVQEDRHARH